MTIRRRDALLCLSDILRQQDPDYRPFADKNCPAFKELKKGAMIHDGRYLFYIFDEPQHACEKIFGWIAKNGPDVIIQGNYRNDRGNVYYYALFRDEPHQQLKERST